MSQGGAFNVSQLIRELGLQTISGDTMRVLDTIQPTMLVADLQENTPPHVSPSAMFGFIVIGGGGNAGIIELQCLAPGGGFIEWLFQDNVFTDALFRVTTTASGVTNVVASAGQLSRDPIVSIVREGNVPATGNPGAFMSRNNQMVIFSPRSIFVPRAAFFQVELITVNAASAVSFGWREVPASEHVPAPA